jgi:gliding motility-associated-like protein
MKNIWIFCFTLACLGLNAQTSIGLIAYYPLDSTLADVTGNTANTGFPMGDPSHGCGVEGDALYLDGGQDQIAFMGPVTNEFDTEDFTVSLYFKSTGVGGTQVLFAKQRLDCTTDNAIFIRYVPLNRTVSVYLGESPSVNVQLSQRLSVDFCWHHITVVRKGGMVKLYVNAQFAGEVTASKRVNIYNDGDLILGGSDCLTGSETTFKGYIDEFRVYNRALDPEEIAELYSSPDMIVNQDAIIFLGNSIDIDITKTCANQFTWSPSVGLDPPNTAQTTITPIQKGDFTYKLAFTDTDAGCTAIDSINISVIDPQDLDCTQLFIPNAFTPNGQGPAKNETFGISNPFAIQELISFEIFDRWGNRVFATEDPFQRWDGVYKGEAVNPGVMLYKVQYRCNGEVVSEAGSLTILR